MLNSTIIDVIIPAMNEEEGIGQVIDEIPKDLVREIIVADNNSTDGTARVARSKGAVVLNATEPGYGNACLCALQYVHSNGTAPDIVVFLDGDHSDFPEQMMQLVSPIIENAADMVIGSRVLGRSENGSLTVQQIFGNWLATRMLRIFYGVRFTDLGPFRAIRYRSLLQLNMNDPNYGWTVEMQVKAAKQHLKCIEVPVDYRIRKGRSKVSGTLKGTIGAGFKIIYILFKYL